MKDYLNGAIISDTKINTDNIVLTTNFSSHDIPGFVADPDQIKDYVHNLWLDVNSVATTAAIKDTIVIDQKFDYLLRNESGQIDKFLQVCNEKIHYIALQTFYCCPRTCTRCFQPLTRL